MSGSPWKRYYLWEINTYLIAKMLYAWEDFAPFSEAHTTSSKLVVLSCFLTATRSPRSEPTHSVSRQRRTRKTPCNWLQMLWYISKSVWPSLTNKATTNETATEWKISRRGWSTEPNICSPRLPKPSLIQTFALCFFIFLFCVNQCKNTCKTMLSVYGVSSCITVDGILLCSVMIHSFLVIAVHLQAVVYEETAVSFDIMAYIWQVTISTLLYKINK